MNWLEDLSDVLAVPLTRSNFDIFGDVIDDQCDATREINEARFDRYDEICEIDIADHQPLCISMVCCRAPTQYPICIDVIERHPLGSQMFVAMSDQPMFVCVAPADSVFDISNLMAFVTNGRQAINYRRGVWHMPLIGTVSGQQFLVVERSGQGNFDVQRLTQEVLLEA